MNIDYIIDEVSVSYILKNETPTFEFNLNNECLIKCYKLLNNLSIGVYKKDILDNQSYNNISGMNYTIKDIEKINDECKQLYDSYNVLIKHNVFEEVDIQHYKQKLDDKIKLLFNRFVDIVFDLEMDS